MAREAGRRRGRGADPRRRDDRQGERRDSVARGRQGARDSPASRATCIAVGSRDHPARGRGHGQRRGRRGKAAGALTASGTAGGTRAAATPRCSRRRARHAARAAAAAAAEPRADANDNASAHRPSARSPRRRSAAARGSWASTSRVVHGTGPDGRVTHEDLDAQSPAGGPVVSASAASGSALARAHRRGAVVPSSACAARSPRRCRSRSAASRTSRYVEEVDVTELEALRAQLNKK